jgi:3-hydroxyisobutyrate dehydrogenase-like beta-hydroxyacid dehydrogenase
MQQGVGTTIGWIGLGKLGLPMAASLARAGHAVHGYDRDEARLTLATSQGIRVVASQNEAARSAAIVFTSLPDDEVLERVMLGADGLVARLPPGAVLAETSTVSPRASARVAESAASAGIAYLRLPISPPAPGPPSTRSAPSSPVSPARRPGSARRSRRATPSSPST